MPDMTEDAAKARARRLIRMRDRLVGCGLAADAKDYLLEAAAAESESEIVEVEAEVERVCGEAAAHATKKVKTFRDVCEAWTSGLLHQRFPDRVSEMTQERHQLVAYRLGHICQTIGDIPLTKLTKADCELALKNLPSELSASSRSEYARLIPRVLRLAVLGDYLEYSPLPERWAPRRGQRREFQLLYPTEDAQLMLCKAVPRERRLLWGFLVRVGCRLREALRLVYGDIDWKTGRLTIRKTKTGKPRSFLLEDDVLRALRKHRDTTGGSDDEPIWALSFGKTKQGKGDRRQARTFREDLAACRIDRRELHEDTEESRNITVHDLRGSRVTIWLALGKPLPWIMRRTGHRKTAMIDVYMRAVEDTKERGLTDYEPLDKLLFGPPKTRSRAGQARARDPQNQIKKPPVSSGAYTAKDDESHQNQAFRPGTVGRGGAQNHPGPGSESGAGQQKSWSRGAAGGESGGVGPTAESARNAGPAAPEDLSIEERLVAIEEGLQRDLSAAIAEKQWGLAESLARELAERRRERVAPSVPSLDRARGKKRGEQ